MTNWLLANKINWIKVFINNIVNNRKHYLIETYSSTTKVAEQLSNGIQVPLLTFINLNLPLFTCISHSVDWIARLHPELKRSWKVGWTAEQWLSVTFSYLFSHISVDWIVLFLLQCKSTPEQYSRSTIRFLVENAFISFSM